MTSVASAGVQGFSTIGILQSLRSSKTSDIGAVLWMALHDSGVANLKAMFIILKFTKTLPMCLLLTSEKVRQKILCKKSRKYFTFKLKIFRRIIKI